MTSSIPLVTTIGIDDVMRVWEGGYGRHLLDLPEAHPDDSFDEMELWDSEDEFFPRHPEDEESSSSDDEDEENESEHVHDAEEEEADPEERLSDHTGDMDALRAEPLEAAEREEETNNDVENDTGGEPTEPSSKKHRVGPS